MNANLTSRPSEARRNVDELLSILCEQDAIAQRLLDLIGRERDALVHGKPATLDPVTIEKAELADRMADAERRRLEWVADWAGVDDPRRIKLSEVIERVSPSERRALAEMRESLSHHVFGAVAANKRNGLLLSSLMKMLRGLIEQVLGLQDGVGHRYEANGAAGGRVSPARGLLDTRI